MNIQQIYFTRFLAAISIVIFHFGTNLPIFSGSLAFIFKHANIGVSFFYILSGFIMIIAYKRDDRRLNSLDYLKNRFARIYPTYFIALLLYIIIHRDFLVWPILLNLFTLQAWVPGEVLTLNGPGWSISVEFFFYLVFPLLLNRIYLKNKNRWLIAVAVLVIWMVTQLLFHYFIRSGYFKGFPSKSYDLIYYSPLIHINQFLVGNLAGLFFLEKMKRRKYDLAIILMICLFVLLLKFVPLDFHNGLMAIVFAPLILLVSANTGSITKLLSLKPFIYLGEISFGIYILQMPVYSLAKGATLHFYPSLYNQGTVFFSIYLIILLLCSMISLAVIEKPCRQIIKNISLKRRQA